MKKIKFNKLTIKNFRNINELEINFNDNTTEIVASNGVGKTNSLSAILWCLFGKNIYDDKIFTISPIINKEEDNSINTIVKLIINDNYVIERSYVKRLTTIKTGYIIDGKEELVVMTQSQFKEELLNNFVDEETFKSLSNINYIPSLHWKDLKQLIFDLIGDISIEEIFLNSNFTLIQEYVEKFGIDKTQKLLSDTDKELNEDIKKLEVEYQTLINVKESYVATDEQNLLLINRKKEIEDKLYKLNNIEKEREIIRKEYFDKKISLDNLISERNNAENKTNVNEDNIKNYELLIKENSFNIENERTKETNLLEHLKDNYINFILEEKNKLECNELNLDIIRKNGIELKEKELKIENSKCPSCHQDLSEEIINNTLQKLKEEKDNKLQKLQENYLSVKDLIKLNKDNIEKKEKELTILNEQLEQIATKKYENIEETSKQKELRIVKEELQLKNKELFNYIEKLNSEINIKEQELNSINIVFNVEDGLPLKLELDDINNKIATTVTLNKISDDINKTLTNLNLKKDNKIINKNKIQEVIKFNNIKAELLKKKIRKYFNLVDFRIKEFTIDGQEQETFKITNENNIEWKDINNGHKILIGIDLLIGIMKAKEIYVPIIIDNGEIITSNINIEETQLIIARAEKDTPIIKII